MDVGEVLSALAQGRVRVGDQVAENGELIAISNVDGKLGVFQVETEMYARDGSRLPRSTEYIKIDTVRQDYHTQLGAAQDHMDAATVARDNALALRGLLELFEGLMESAAGMPPATP